MQTKSDLQEIIEALDNRIDYYTKERERHQRQLAHSRELFMELYEEDRTLKLRHGWLEATAETVCESCAEHLPDAIERLRDDLGLPLKQEQT